MKMYKSLFMTIEVRLGEENKIFYTCYFVIASPPAMLLEIESWNK